MISFRCGDTVFHRPSRETWLVAWCEGDRLAWCGWPPGTADADDCLLVDKASDDKHHNLVAEILRGSRPDRNVVRRLYAA